MIFVSEYLFLLMKILFLCFFQKYVAADYDDRNRHYQETIKGKFAIKNDNGMT